jgi:hypothetical protein
MMPAKAQYRSVKKMDGAVEGFGGLREFAVF